MGWKNIYNSNTRSMILDIRKLKKIEDILNSEGSILGVYQIGDKLYLGSYLTNKSGIVYYSIEKAVLKMYLNSVINLKNVYLASEDFIVTTKFRKETTSYIKEDLVDFIQFSELLYSEIPDSLKNKMIVEIIENL